MKRFKPVLRTTMPAIVALPRLYVAFVCLVDGLRALEINGYLGESVLLRVPFNLTSGPFLHIGGWLLIVAGALLALGLLTRVAAVVPLLISLAIIVDAYDQIGWVHTAEALNFTARALGTGTVSVLLLARGAGVFSLDAMLSAKTV